VDAVWYADFVERLVEKTRVFRLGDPLDVQTTIGPVITRKHMNWLHEMVVAGVAEHEMLTVLCGGKPYTPSEWEGTPLANGNYYEPTIVAVDPIWAQKLLSTDVNENERAKQAITDLHHTNRLFQQELFGPVVVVAPFVDEDHAITMANDTVFGLGASIWSHDFVQAQSLAQKVRAGIGTLFVCLFFVARCHSLSLSLFACVHVRVVFCIALSIVDTILFYSLSHTHKLS
jgi:acyl-CoA reductase-like NAD-dependent aldehyde dehydrogenase